MSTISIATAGQPDDNLHTLHQRFMSRFDQQALRNAGVCVAYAHLDADTHAEEHYGEFGLLPNVLGTTRWMRCNGLVHRHLRGRYEELSVELEPNETNGSSHLEIQQGGFRLIVVHDKDGSISPEDLKSKYSRDMVEQNAGPLFAMCQPTPTPTPTDEPCMAVLFHSRSGIASIPNRLEVRFPDLYDWAAPHLDLFALFPELNDEMLVMAAFNELLAPSVPEEDIPDQSFPGELPDAGEETA